MDPINIPGVLVSPARRIQNPLGDVVTFINQADAGWMGVAEVYGSFIKPGAKKGWRRHNEVTLNIVVPVGSIRFVLYDDRTQPAQTLEVVLGTHNYLRLTVPPGVWMAFEGLGDSDSLLMDAIDKLHDPKEADTRPINEIPYAW